MVKSTIDSYDALPYITRPRRATHPDTLSVNGRLAGLRTAPATRCRFLEVGCGTGGNLIPMAASLPDSEFVGIDLSSVQITQARAGVEELGLKNVRFEAKSLMDVDSSFGQFDFILAHGVYSWVPPEVRDGLLKLYRDRLEPHGVGYVSYNTYPGWQFRAAARQAMLTRVAHMDDDPATKTAAARQYIRFLADQIPDQDSPFAAEMRAFTNFVERESTHYVYHDFLGSHNHPLLFREFARHAQENGLAYIGDVPPHSGLKGVTEEAAQKIREWSHDRVDVEQHLDFLQYRMFRRSLVCRGDALPAEYRELDALPALLVSARSQPRTPDAGPDDVQEFLSADGVELSTRNPVVTSLLRCLYSSWPAGLPVADVERRVAESVGALWASQPDRARSVLHQQLVDLYRYGMLDLHTSLPAFAVETPERPVGFPPARLLAMRQELVPTIRHFETNLSPIERFVLVRLDGSRGQVEIADALQEANRSGAIELPPNGTASQCVAEALQRLVINTLIQA